MLTGVSGSCLQDGALLNLCSWHRPDPSCMLDADADLANYRLLVASMVEDSSLPPIMAIRRDPVLSEKPLGRILFSFEWFVGEQTCWARAEGCATT